jgi:disease resistance protein RPM1
MKAVNGKKLHFTAGCFPKLRFLVIWHAPELNGVQIDEGAMPSLARLYFGACHELKFLPQGIEHLTNLEEFALRDTSEELREKLQQKREPNEGKDDLLSIRHIRKVIVD